MYIHFMYFLYFDDQINAELVSVRNFHKQNKKIGTFTYS